MKKLLFLISMFIAICVFFSGCATVDTLDATRERLPKRVKSITFLYPPEDVFQVAKKACHDLGLTIYSQDEADGKIYAKSSWKFLSVLRNEGVIGSGEQVGIYFTTLSDGPYTKVEVVVQKSNLLDLGFTDWRQRILKLMAEHLKPEEK